MGKIDHIVPQILQICLENLKVVKTKRSKLILLTVIFFLFYYNAPLTMGLLNEKGLCEDVFKEAFNLQNSMKNEWDYARFFFGLSSVLSVGQLPQYILQNGQEIGKVLVVLTTKTLELREEEEEDEDDDDIDDEGKEKKILSDIN